MNLGCRLFWQAKVLCTNKHSNHRWMFCWPFCWWAGKVWTAAAGGVEGWGTEGGAGMGFLCPTDERNAWPPFRAAVKMAAFCWTCWILGPPPISWEAGDAFTGPRSGTSTWICGRLFTAATCQNRQMTSSLVQIWGLGPVMVGEIKWKTRGERGQGGFYSVEMHHILAWSHYLSQSFAQNMNRWACIL